MAPHASRRESKNSPALRTFTAWSHNRVPVDLVAADLDPHRLVPRHGTYRC
jgi:hypothetical protein